MPLHRSSVVARVRRLTLVVSDLHESERFFADAFDAVATGRGESAPEVASLLGLPHATSRHVELRIGQQEVALMQFEPAGRPYPPGSTSTDLWFQHFAIIVSDMAAAHAQLEAAGRFTPISQGGPVTLPAGVTAFKFRDADGHPLELLAFPADGGSDHWRERRGRDLHLGIDHSAISVRDTDVSRAFFEERFGLHQAEQTHNTGAEQSRMDDVADADVVVTGMAPENPPPHVETLGYTVGSRRPIDPATAANDIAASFFTLDTPDLEPIVEALTAGSARFVSPGIVVLPGGTRAICVLDPDGHRYVVEERSST